jgi:DNA-binding response OmpR family regulator
MNVGGERTVLVVEDEDATTRAYQLALEDEYDVRVASTVEAAVEALEGDDIDVALLDRRMPDEPGDSLLDHDAVTHSDCSVAMVTAVTPDFDIVDLGIDDYVQKPVGPTELRDTVERLVALRAYSERKRELSAKQVKRNVLEIEKTAAELESSEEFAALESRIESLESEIETLESSYNIV